MTINHLLSERFQSLVFGFNGEAYDWREAVALGRECDLRPVYRRSPEALPAFDPAMWASVQVASLLFRQEATGERKARTYIVVLGHITPIPPQFVAHRIMKGRNGTIKVKGPVRSITGHKAGRADGLRDQSRPDISLPADFEGVSETVSVRDSESTLDELGAGKAVTGNETDWRDLV